MAAVLSIQSTALVLWRELMLAQAFELVAHVSLAMLVDVLLYFGDALGGWTHYQDGVGLRESS